MEQVDTETKVHRPVRNVPRSSGVVRDTVIRFKIGKVLDDDEVSRLTELVFEAFGGIPTVQAGVDEFELRAERGVLYLELGGGLRHLAGLLSPLVINTMNKLGIPCYPSEDNDPQWAQTSQRLTQILVDQRYLSDDKYFEHLWMKLGERQRVCLGLAQFVIYGLGLSVYGGFVRDLVINGEDADSIDVRVEKGDSPMRHAEAIVRKMESLGAKFAASSSGVASYSLGFQLDGKGFRVNLVDTQRLRDEGQINKPYVDADVNNFIIDREHGLTLDVRIRDLSLAESIKHCRKRRFVFLCDYGADPRVYRQRLKELLRRGYTCVSDVNRDCKTELESVFRGRFALKDVYVNRTWEIADSGH